MQYVALGGGIVFFSKQCIKTSDKATSVNDLNDLFAFFNNDISPINA